MNSPQAIDQLQLEFVDSIERIGEQTWNSLTGTDNPFMRYEFLHALEITGCTCRETGWQPHHVVVRSRQQEGQEQAQVVAVMPLYLKSNSWGEYVFDWSWANAYKSYGYQYYPKFVTAAPFTPSEGRRIFTRSGETEQALCRLIFEKIKEKAEFIGASSWHVLFATAEEHEQLASLGIQSRIATQFHWYNRDYQSFDDFLATLSSRKRKSIRKERSHVYGQGIRFRRTEGAEIDAQQWSDFYLYYQSTYLMRGMQGYLQEDFFTTVAQTMPEQLFMISAEQDGRDIAAALFFKNREKLFGRYWGCRRDHQFLHFETCYYQGQDYAIEHGQRSFDSGAQGEHKIQRGFEPIFTHSNHWIANPAFADAIANFLQDERPHIEAYHREAQSLLPFRKDQSPVSKQ